MDTAWSTCSNWLSTFHSAPLPIFSLWVPTTIYPIHAGNNPHLFPFLHQGQLPVHMSCAGSQGPVHKRAPHLVKYSDVTTRNYVFFFLKLFVCLREPVNRGRAERKEERDRIPKRLHTVSTEPGAGLEPTNHKIMTWAEIKSGILNQISHPSVSPFGILNSLKIMCPLFSFFTGPHKLFSPSFLTWN